MESEKSESKRKVSRRDFLKYSAGVAVGAAGVAMALGKIQLPSLETNTTPDTPTPVSEPIVVSVSGEELTVMTERGEVKVRDPGLAAAIAGKLQ